MISEIKESGVKKLLPERRPDSHKGENGKVLIIGGSIDYFGAPILSAMGALYSGVDLVYLYVPECNFEAARSYLPDFIVKKYSGDYFKKSDADAIIEFGKQCDSVLIGPGLGNHEESTLAVLQILKKLKIPTVLDAQAIEAIKKIEKFPLDQSIIVTPHHNEFQHLIDREIIVKEDDTKSIILLRSVSMDLHINVLLKGHTDYISSEEGFVEKNVTGNAGMTVGGTGDVLSGMVSSFLAQGLEAFDAAKCSAFYAGKAGDYLRKTMGNNFCASDLAKALPYVLR